MAWQIYSKALPQFVCADFLRHKVFQLLVQFSHELGAYINKSQHIQQAIITTNTSHQMITIQYLTNKMIFQNCKLLDITSDMYKTKTRNNDELYLLSTGFYVIYQTQLTITMSSLCHRVPYIIAHSTTEHFSICIPILTAAYTRH